MILGALQASGHRRNFTLVLFAAVLLVPNSGSFAPNMVRLTPEPHATHDVVCIPAKKPTTRLQLCKAIVSPVCQAHLHLYVLPAKSLFSMKSMWSQNVFQCPTFISTSTQGAITVLSSILHIGFMKPGLFLSPLTTFLYSSFTSSRLKMFL